MAEPILSVRGLHVRFSLRGRSLHALRGIDREELLCVWEALDEFINASYSASNVPYLGAGALINKKFRKKQFFLEWTELFRIFATD